MIYRKFYTKYSIWHTLEFVHELHIKLFNFQNTNIIYNYITPITFILISSLNL